MTVAVHKAGSIKIQYGLPKLSGLHTTRTLTQVNTFGTDYSRTQTFHRFGMVCLHHFAFYLVFYNMYAYFLLIILY